MVLAVNGYDEPKGVVEKFVQEKGLRQKVLLRGACVARGTYGVSGFPTSFLVDRSGTIVACEIGFSPAKAKTRELEGRIADLVSSRR